MSWKETPCFVFQAYRSLASNKWADDGGRNTVCCVVLNGHRQCWLPRDLAMTNIAYQDTNF
jgi:hypothetical protein